MSTLVFHHGALGDSVLVWPVLRALAPVTLVAPLHKARLAARWISGVEAVDGDSAEFSGLFAPAASMEVGEPMRRRLGGAARVVSFISSGDDAWWANVRELAHGADVVCVPARPPEPEAVAIMAWQARRLGEAGVALRPVLAGRRLNGDGPVVIHPGSGGRAKCWPAERFEELLRHYAAMGREAVVVLGEVERERMDARVLARWRRELEVAEPESLLELSELISGAAVFIGNDSGPTHLAAQLGVATVAMFGPTDPRVWSPVGPAVSVLAPPTPRTMDWLGVERVIEAAARLG